MASTRTSRTRRRPARRPPAPRAAAADTRTAIFQAAADAFSAHGFDGVTVDDIAAAAGVNKAMIYYHFEDKLTLYRSVVAQMLQSAGTRIGAIAAAPDAPHRKLRRFVESFVEFTDEHPWGPPLMLREIAEGAPHLDVATLSQMRIVFAAFGRIVADGQARGVFRPVNPVLAYMSAVGPLLLNAARERAARRPGRRDLPMFVEVPRAELVAHMQSAMLRLLSRD